MSDRALRRLRILVTGAGGLIGGYLSRAFASEGHDVTATYRSSKPELPGASPPIRFVRLDVAEGLDRIDAVDVVIHAAARTVSVPDSTAFDFISSNVIGTLNVAQYATAIRPRLLVYLSTLSVYGVIKVSELREDTPLNRPDMYGVTKYLAEMILKEHAQDFPSLCIRLPGVVGAGYFTPWLGTVLKRACRSEPITFYNPDSMFNNVVDLIELHAFISRVLQAEHTGFQIVNLASTEPIRIRDVVQLIVSMTGSHSKILEEKSDRQSFSINTEKVMKDFGFQPSTTRSVIQRYVEQNLAALAAVRDGRA